MLVFHINKEIISLPTGIVVLLVHSMFYACVYQLSYFVSVNLSDITTLHFWRHCLSLDLEVFYQTGWANGKTIHTLHPNY